MPQRILEVKGAVEGIVDEAVLRVLIEHAGATAGEVYGKNGKDHLKERLPGYNSAANHGPWVVLMDLDDDECAPPALDTILPAPSRYMCFRLAVREIESWLLADRARIARYLRVPEARIPGDPESLNEPKQELVRAAGHSTSRAIRDDMVPRAGSGRKVGSGYTARMIEFIISRWRPDDAASRSDSLGRCIRRIRELVDGYP
jgi:hypothetical protein